MRSALAHATWLVLCAVGTARPAHAEPVLQMVSSLPEGASVPPGAVFSVGVFRLDQGVAQPLGVAELLSSSGEIVDELSPDPYVAQALVRAPQKGNLVVEARAGGLSAKQAFAVDPKLLTPLTMTLDPPVITKRGDGPQQAWVVVEGEDGATPQLSTTNATLSAVQRLGPGRWRAQLTPDAVPYPQVAVITAWRAWPDAASPAVSLTHAVLPLGAAITLPGETRPNVDISVEIAGKSFGPVRSDAEGRFKVDVVVPAGAGIATGTSTDKLGTRRVTTIDLRVPPLERVVVVPLSTEARAGELGIGIAVLTLNRAGQPSQDGAFNSSAQGRVVDLRPVAPGRALGRYLPTAQPTLDTITVKTPDGNRGSATLRVVAGVPATFAAELKPKLVTAPSRAAAKLKLGVADARQRVVDDAALTGQATWGTFVLLQDAQGAREARYLPPALRTRWSDPLELTAAAPPGTLGARLALRGARVLELDAFDRPVREVATATGQGSSTARLAGAMVARRATWVTAADGSVHGFPVARAPLRQHVEVALMDPLPVDVQAELTADGAVHWRVVGGADPRTVQITAADGTRAQVVARSGDGAPPGPLPLLVQDVETGVASVVSAP